MTRAVDIARGECHDYAWRVESNGVVTAIVWRGDESILIAIDGPTADRWMWRIYEKGHGYTTARDDDGLRAALRELRRRIG